MPVALSSRGQELLDSLPPFLSGDPTVQGIVDAVARELVRVEDAGIAIRSGLTPQNADDATNNLLAAWEYTVGLTVRPAGLSVDTRRARVLARMLGAVATGEEWVAALTTLFGTGAWTYEENTANFTVSITIPYGSGSLSAEQAYALAREVTPAHIAITVSYDDVFLVGLGQIGLDELP